MILPNDLLGDKELPALVNHSPTPLDTTLNSSEKTEDEEDTQTPPSGVIYLTILTEDNLMAV